MTKISRNTRLKKILSDFDNSSGTYLDFAKSASDLVIKILAASGVSVHSVTWRCKARESLDKKISRVDKHYQELEQITDLAAMRITTYFSDDIDSIAKIIEAEFEIDRPNSIDKRIVLDPDRFGYQSLHFVAKLSDARRSLLENQKFASLKIEIQIRSILQHAWAEIEHDIGYKSASGIPREVKRRFARVAGLLELADAEFTSIRTSLSEYAGSVISEIQDDPVSVELDMVSLRALYNIESECKKLDCYIAKKMNATLDSEDISEKYVARLHVFDIYNVKQLESAIAYEFNSIGKFVEYWMARPSESDWVASRGEVNSVGTGIGLFYLIYILLWRKRDPAATFEYFEKYNIGLAAERTTMVKELMGFEV